MSMIMRVTVSMRMIMAVIVRVAMMSVAESSKANKVDQEPQDTNDEEFIKSRKLVSFP